MPTSKETINAHGAPEAVGPYVHAVKVGGLLFCSGQIPLDAQTGELVGDSAAEQAQRCLTNLAAVVAAAGADLKTSAVKLTVYMTDLSEFAPVNEVYAKFFDGAEPPARVAVGVSALPKGAQVEIDAVVALSD
jgi:2-iminobutanoate/2-iminopropanoate deaminase